MLIDLRRRLNVIRDGEATAERIYGAADRSKKRNKANPSGTRFHCPICARWYRRFQSFGLKGRPNARCPGCGSLERHRFLWLYLSETHNTRRRVRSVLHVAPETCLQSVLLQQPGILYIGVDRYDDDANAEQQDLTALKFSSESFDLLICNHVLEHILDDRAALSEIRRVLRPSGRALIMVPIDRNRRVTYENPSINSTIARQEAFGHPYHVRICGWDYAGRIRELGFNVREVHSTSLTEHKRRINRINKTVLYDCTPR